MQGWPLQHPARENHVRDTPSGGAEGPSPAPPHQAGSFPHAQEPRAAHVVLQKPAHHARSRFPMTPRDGHTSQYLSESHLLTLLILILTIFSTCLLKPPSTFRSSRAFQKALGHQCSPPRPHPHLNVELVFSFIHPPQTSCLAPNPQLPRQKLPWKISKLLLPLGLPF